MEVLEDLCSSCRIQKPKYTCPACRQRTCSLECSRQHKADTGCSGRVDPTRFVKRTDLVETPEHLNRDYSFLQTLGRRVDLGKRAATGATGGAKRPRVDRRPATRNGVYIKSLPQGMHRSNINKSAWNNKKKTFYWTVEWIVYAQGDSEWSSETTVRPQVPDNLSLQDLVADVFKKKGQQVPEYQVFLHMVGSSANNRKLIPLETEKLLGDQLVGKTVVEFPTILVVSGQGLPPNHSIAGADSSSESDSSSDSNDSSDSSDSSGSDSSDGSDDDDDDGPEELPAETNKD